MGVLNRLTNNTMFEDDWPYAILYINIVACGVKCVININNLLFFHCSNTWHMPLGDNKDITAVCYLTKRSNQIPIFIFSDKLLFKFASIAENTVIIYLGRQVHFLLQF